MHGTQTKDTNREHMEKTKVRQVQTGRREKGGGDKCRNIERYIGEDCVFEASKQLPIGQAKEFPEIAIFWRREKPRNLSTWFKEEQPAMQDCRGMLIIIHFRYDPWPLTWQSPWVQVWGDAVVWDYIWLSAKILQKAQTTRKIVLCVECSECKI